MSANHSRSSPSIYVLAFDFGTQHIGVAVGQTFTQHARALKSIKARDGIPNWLDIESLVTEWNVARILVGLPLHMDTSETPMAVRARKFANRLTARLRLPVELVDERLSSYEAEGLDIEGDIHGRSAVLIMQSWFNRQTL